MNQPQPAAALQPAAHAAATPRWRIVLAMLFVAVGTACMDGYPTEDVSAIDALDMTQAQRLAQMNTLGSAAHNQRRWTYALLPGCVLRIDLDGEAGPGPAFDIPLLGSAVRVKTDKADDTFAVEVKPASPVAQTGVSVLEAQQWVHAVLMTRTLLVVEKACADE